MAGFTIAQLDFPGPGAARPDFHVILVRTKRANPTLFCAWLDLALRGSPLRTRYTFCTLADNCPDSRQADPRECVLEVVRL